MGSHVRPMVLWLCTLCLLWLTDVCYSGEVYMMYATVNNEMWRRRVLKWEVPRLKVAKATNGIQTLAVEKHVTAT